MKKVLLALFTTVILGSLNFSCNLIDSKGNMSSADSLAIAENAPKIEFDHESFDFGTLTEGDIKEHEFVFKNVGKSPLQILNVQVQCGCTVASKPETPVGIGQKDKIVVRFNSLGKVGVNKKFVTIYSNAVPPQTVLSFTAEVLAKQTADSAQAILDKAKKVLK
ncbi:DUF1573 domain-containing protein [Emticicia sp. BO119]|uniref:DUF1573 domain-containing protein n=1 Tax=Emticicia sp. BO119 TaxID=2757768 RepID=UPI0015F0019C|nr:DUF1573 domain-containing protein [Emticicia sp. BO119]MBA4853138.1 DUF1573 domain-containing protein [Emticicia sp. BO119]